MNIQKILADFNEETQHDAEFDFAQKINRMLTRILQLQDDKEKLQKQIEDIDEATKEIKKTIREASLKYPKTIEIDE